MKTLVVALVLVVVVVFAVVWWSGRQQPSLSQTSSNLTSAANRASPESLAQAQQRDFAVTGRVPAYYQTPPDVNTMPPTLTPELFTGNKRLAYEAAKEIPQTLAQLPCYCHCDRGHGHKSLHSCFESEHGENCGICIGELMAQHFQQQGVSVAEIRKRIIAAYGQAEN